VNLLVDGGGEACLLLGDGDGKGLDVSKDASLVGIGVVIDLLAGANVFGADGDVASLCPVVEVGVGPRLWRQCKLVVELAVGLWRGVPDIRMMYLYRIALRSCHRLDGLGYAPMPWASSTMSTS
jgi:hypothetical protein